MPVHDDLGTRMKEFYESVPKTHLMRRVPVAIRIDGKAFHTFTRGFRRPFDDVLIKSMQETTKYLCENIQGCVLGYTQSDEITLILTDYKKLNSEAWFNYEVQKMCSVSASMATMAFNKAFSKNVKETILEWKSSLVPQDQDYLVEMEKYHLTLQKAAEIGAMFDSRCFNIPREEVTNLIFWRQLDASRNSIQMCGQAYFSHSQLEGKTCSNIQDMLMEYQHYNWNNIPTHRKRGSCCIKEEYQDSDVDIKDGYSPKSHWIIDKEIPIFKGDGRNYIEKLIYFDDEEVVKKNIKIDLTLHEEEAFAAIKNELRNGEGVISFSKLSQKTNITRYLFNNLLTKLTAAGVIITKPMGVKGTYIKIIS